MGKRTAIIQAAITVFQENGIEKTKISDIVKKAQVAQGTFYLYFPSKLALMPAIAEVMVEKTLEVVHKTVQDRAPFQERMEQLVDAIFLVTKDYHEVLAMIYSGLASTEHLKEWETVYAPFYQWLSQFLQEGKEKEEIRLSIQPDRTAKLIIGLIESAAEQIYLYDMNQEEQARIQKAEVNEFLRNALGMAEK
ncbi:TetR family transcriptional regulator [Sporosarcina sp. 179-K 3D1 HS]|uniref:TetR family transcriptional regulator n=1 Tax=Sporosarcina sp. 179-K 3D1 HS TaxID=3232169 RepID=UPI0039A2E79D